MASSATNPDSRLFAGLFISDCESICSSPVQQGDSQVVSQGLAEPGGLLCDIPLLEPVAGLVGLQERLLDDARQIDLALQAGVELEAGQQHQILAERFQVALRARSLVAHDGPLW